MSDPLSSDDVARPPDIAYRYTLTRRWQEDDGHRGTVAWVMLNPSTADEFTDDQTIRKITHLSCEHGFSDLIVVNLFAARSTNPKHLVAMGRKARGPENVGHLAETFMAADAIVFAWGSPHNYRRVEIGGEYTRADEWVAGVVRAACAEHKPVLCCGRNNDGSPKHPCYLANDTKLVPYDCG